MDKRGVSPAFSTIILTAGVIVLILVAMTYASNTLNLEMAKNEFSSNEQFMQTTGQQIDDIAWTIGRTQTVSYSSKFGQIDFEPSVLKYTIEVHSNTLGWQTIDASFETGIILFNMPVSAYSMGNNYFKNYSDFTFLKSGASAPVSQVFCVEKLPMTDGSYLRIVVVPTIRVLDSANYANYSKFYLPTLENGTHLYRSQSVTMSGQGIEKVTQNDVDQIRITATFPKADLGFDSTFFNFNQLSETKVLSAASVVEFYTGYVCVTIGQV